MPTDTMIRGQRKARSMSASNIPVAEGPTDEQIRMRAYEIYRARGSAPGNPEADWHQAEQELRGRMTLLGRT